jgi:enamine deaminase RidA (YjgF/YER057c/UK114 family)
MRPSVQIEHSNPPGIYKHPAFTRVISVQGPMKLIFVAGQTPSDENYRPVCVGDYRGQYLKVIENLTAQLAAAGATWDNVVYQRIYVLDMDRALAVTNSPDVPKPWHPDRAPGSTLVGVTRLSHPDFLIEIDLMAVAAPS